MKIELKIGRHIYDIDRNDVILDNGACYLLITRRVGDISYKPIPIVSKKLFKDLKTCGLIRNCKEKGCLTYYKFNIDRMVEMGYNVVID